MICVDEYHDVDRNEILEKCGKVVAKYTHVYELETTEYLYIFKASELELTRERKEHFLEKYGCDSKLSAACDILENGFEDAIQILSFPENIRRRIRTTNVLERLNEEIRRRERVIRIFPNINSITRIIGTLLMEKDTEWLASPRKYLEFNSNNI
ncbi:hypothetical protein EfmJHP36_21070 [Enterococcus faecium]|nr:hypothetical protein EfmJHP36_21070 [Enterococcus faecium]